MKFINAIMNGISKAETAFRFVRSMEKGLKAFKAEFEGNKPIEIVNDEN
ncbi:hypothetical protein [Carboxylicivirga sp. M1479]|nr:hypothetical protein [Carboxylicivirga sp. M1479]